MVAVEIVDPPPAALGGDPGTGPGSRSAGRSLMAAGAVLTFSRVRLAFTVEGRDPRRHVSAVDARGEPEPATSETPAAAAPGAVSSPARAVRATSAHRAAPDGAPPTGAATPDAIGGRRARRTTSRCCAAAPGGASARRETGDAPEEDPG